MSYRVTLDKDKDSPTGMKEEKLSFFLDTAMSQCESNFEWMIQKP